MKYTNLQMIKWCYSQQLVVKQNTKNREQNTSSSLALRQKDFTIEAVFHTLSNIVQIMLMKMFQQKGSHSENNQAGRAGS